MEQIAPLAKILAEANGIEWQGLRGSGSGGMIVEQDVLNHLARIMSGEEEPPPTPVDAPPPDWNGEELPAGLGLGGAGLPTADMLSSAGVDSDITALVAQVQSAPPAAAPAPEDDGLDFELDDDQEPAAVHAAPLHVEPALVAPVRVAAPAPMPFPELQTAAAFAAPAPLAPEPAMPVPAAPEPVAASAKAGLGAGLGSLLSRLYQPAPQAPADPAPPASTSVFQPAAPTLEIPAPAPQPAPATFALEPAPLPAAELPMPELPAAEVVVPEVEAPAVPTVSAEFVPEVAPQAPTTHAVPAPGAAPVYEPAAEEPVALPVSAEVESAPVQPQPEVAAEPVAAPAAAVARPREAVWFGTYLRRDADVAAAADLRGQLAAALGQDVSLAFLVARAAGRHASGLGLGTVALHDLTSGQARPVQPGALRDALAATNTGDGATPDLLVTDAGALDLDDLHLPHSLTLSVGRVQEGRAALTLQGDVEPARAAAFLTEVAGALAQPIILVI